jgi:hypothetical protein
VSHKVGLKEMRYKQILPDMLRSQTQMSKIKKNLK